MKLLSILILFSTGKKTKQISSKQFARSMISINTTAALLKAVFMYVD